MNNKPHQVWLVEDNEIYRKALYRTIDQLENFTCTADFENAEAMVGELEKNQPDIILLDVQLPGINGIEAMRKINTVSKNIKTIILTSFDEEEKIFDALCAGASGYLLKSSLKKEIGDLLQEVVQGGAPMSPSVANKVIQKFTAMNSPIEKDQKYKLTDRELDVLKFMADGKIKKEIADAMSLSIHTVNTHIRNIYAKLHVDTNTGAVAKGIREKLI